MRVLLGAALCMAALSALPTAQACSLAYLPFDQPQWIDGRLHYVEGSELRRVDGATETALASGFFLTYAPAGEGGQLLVAGQEGLGASCEGDDWLRLLVDGAVAWENDGEARVFAHEGGPFVQMDDGWHRFAAFELHEAGTLPDGVWVLGVSFDGKPVYTHDGTLVVGDRSIALDGYGAFAVAHNATATAVLRSEYQGESELIVVHAGGSVSRTAWASGRQDFGRGSVVAWAGGWAAAVGTAFHVDDAAGEVRTLGPGDSVAVDGDRLLVLDADQSAYGGGGYTVYEDGRATQSWSRGDGNVWTPAAAPTTSGQPVPASSTSLSAGPAPSSPGDEDGQGIPGPTALQALLAMGALAVARRRLRR